jgi:hypothetical protein
MTLVGSQGYAFHLTDFLPDGDRILIVVAADTSGSRTATSAYYLCFQNAKAVKLVPENISFDPEEIPAEFRPCCEGLLGDQLSFAKAQIDHAYYTRYSDLISRTGFPSSRVTPPLTIAQLAQLYMRGGFSEQLEKVYASEFSELNKFLKPVVALPVLYNGTQTILKLDVPEPG